MANNLDRDVAIGMIILSLFFAVNMTPQYLGFIYFAFAVTYLLAVEGKLPEVSISRNRTDFLKVIVIAGVAVFAWLFLSQSAINHFGASTTNLASVVSLLAVNTTSPLATSNPYVFVLVFVFMVPIIETLFFFGTAMPWLMQKLKFSYADKSKWILIVLLMGVLITAFHYSVNMFNNVALMADFIFFTISGLIVLYRKDLSIAILFHMFANLLIALGLLGLIR